MDKQKIYRYPGAQPFSLNQKNVFFGRSKEVKDLYGLLSFEDLVILHSKSGLGKSSLINAGLIPEASKRADYIVRNIRLKVYNPENEEHPISTTREIILENQNQSNFLNKIYPDDKSLWYALKKLQINKSDEKGILLIFDQFEELFTYPENQIIKFARQFSEILFSEIPQRIRKMAALFLHAEPDILTEENQDWLYKKINIKIIIAIRSDRLSLLEKLTRYVPNIMNKRFELKSMQKEEAQKAIIDPARSNGSFISEKFEYEIQAVENILSYLTHKHTKHIETFQLQILCHSLEQKVIENGITVVSINQTRNLNKVFENYYEDKINTIGTEQEILTARKLVEETLVLEEERRRLTLYEGQLYLLSGVTPKLLKKLIDSRLIRAESSIKGGYTYELSHDTLVGPVLKSKNKRQEQEKLEKEERARIEKEKELQLIRKKRRRARQIAIFMSFLAIFSLIVTGIAFQQFQSAQKAKISAEKALQDLKEEEYRRLQTEIKSKINLVLDFIDTEEYESPLRILNEIIAIDSTNKDALELKAFCEQKLRE